MTLRNTSFKIDENMLSQIDAYAIKHRITRSDVIRLAIQRFLEEELKKERVPKIKVEKGDKLW